jgi:cysteine desulfurase
VNPPAIPVYLDFAASTPCEQEVLDAMLPYFREWYGNAASLDHAHGRTASQAVEAARNKAAALVSALSQEIVWTSGATESNNLAIRGLARARRLSDTGAGGHVVTSLTEHKSVLEPCRSLREEGFDVTAVRPGSDGVVTARIVEEALRSDTFLVSVMWANNEVGTINEVEAIGALCRERGIVFHSDATQWVGKMPVDLRTQPIDLLSWSSHKVYGPKGAGALYVRMSSPGNHIVPLAVGGGHEQGLRPGSLNVPGIVGFGEACRIAGERMVDDAIRIARLRDTLEARLLEVAGAVVHGRSVPRVPNIASVTFPLPSFHGDLVRELSAIACSSGSACNTLDRSPSHVLRALGLSPELSRKTLRLSLGRPTTESHIDTAVEHVLSVVERTSRASN